MVSLIDLIKSVLENDTNWATYGKDRLGNIVMTSAPEDIKVINDIEEKRWQLRGKGGTLTISIFNQSGYDDRVAIPSSWDLMRKVQIRVTWDTETNVEKLMEATLNILKVDMILDDGGTTYWDIDIIRDIEEYFNTHMGLVACFFSVYFKRFITI